MIVWCMFVACSLTGLYKWMFSRTNAMDSFIIVTPSSVIFYLFLHNSYKLSFQECCLFLKIIMQDPIFCAHSCQGHCSNTVLACRASFVLTCRRLLLFALYKYWLTCTFRLVYWLASQQTGFFETCYTLFSVQTESDAASLCNRFPDVSG